MPKRKGPNNDTIKNNKKSKLDINDDINDINDVISSLQYEFDKIQNGPLQLIGNKPDPSDDYTRILVDSKVRSAIINNKQLLIDELLSKISSDDLDKLNRIIDFNHLIANVWISPESKLINSSSHYSSEGFSSFVDRNYTVDTFRSSANNDTINYITHYSSHIVSVILLIDHINMKIYSNEDIVNKSLDKLILTDSLLNCFTTELCTDNNWDDVINKIVYRM